MGHLDESTFVPQGAEWQAPRLVSLPTVSDPRGSLTWLETNKCLPFAIQRVFYLYAVQPQRTRGGHAHAVEEQLLICLGGSMDVEVHGLENTQTFRLDSPQIGLFLPRMTWATEQNFAPGSFCLVLSSTIYEPSDYIHDFEEFRALKAKEQR